ncbi:MAG: glycine cleavage system aminomethyltransferase GcvT [Oligosphaeraceae bacterium]|nr:glycine cleavage system aminomethyltransferase GcvT [Oligosphaeraceae bacterium]
MAEELLPTPLYERHLALDGRMVPFAGWNMPVQYAEGILAEHRHCRSAAALFDICHMGEFRISGATAAAGLDRMMARAVQNQSVGSCRYNFLLNEQGGILDDLIVYRLDENEFYLVVNAGCRESDLAWLQKHLPATSIIVDESLETAKLDLQGPAAAQVLMDMGAARENLPTHFRWNRLRLLDIDLLISRTGYTGELGYELYFNAEMAVKLWDALLQHDMVKPAGLGARDTLRLEMGYPLYGHEMDTGINPVELGYAAMLKLDNTREFIGRQALDAKPKKQLIALQLESKRAARAEMPVLWQGEQIGLVSSGGLAPSLGFAVAMALVRADLDLPEGSKLEIVAGRVNLPAAVCKLPFYKHGSLKDNP